MKKLTKLVLALILLMGAAFVALTLFMGFVVHKGVETVGPQLTKTDLKLGRVSISLFSGKGEIHGFILGNPEGYESPSAITVERARLDLNPRSLFSDKVIIHSIQVDGPEITFEGGLKRNNLRKILKNIEAITATTDRPPGQPGEKEPAQGKDEPPGQTRIQVDEFILKSAKVHYAVPGFAGQTIAITLPNVALRNLGQNKEGITVAELTQLVFQALIQDTTQAIGEAGAQGLEDVLKDLGNDTTQDLGKSLNEISRLLLQKE